MLALLPPRHGPQAVGLKFLHRQCPRTLSHCPVFVNHPGKQVEQPNGVKTFCWEFHERRGLVSNLLFFFFFCCLEPLKPKVGCTIGVCFFLVGSETFEAPFEASFETLEASPFRPPAESKPPSTLHRTRPPAPPRPALLRPRPFLSAGLSPGGVGEEAPGPEGWRRRVRVRS